MVTKVLQFAAAFGGAKDGEVSTPLLTAKGVRLERIVSHGQASPESFWYDQTQAEWVMVLSGAARLAVEDDPDELTLGPGDAIFLPPHCRHRVTWTDPAQPTVWLALFVDAILDPTEASGA